MDQERHSTDQMLEELNLVYFKERFKANEVDIDLLRRMNDSDFQILIPEFRPRVLIRNYIRDMCDNELIGNSIDQSIDSADTVKLNMDSDVDVEFLALSDEKHTSTPTLQRAQAVDLAMLQPVKDQECLLGGNEDDPLMSAGSTKECGTRSSAVQTTKRSLEKSDFFFE